jgi:hypothetical protein
MALDWRMPFPAQWRVDFMRSQDLCDSWEMLLQAKHSDSFLKPNWMTQGAAEIKSDRRRWTTVLGYFHYPCWTDREGRGYLQPFQRKKLTLRGPAVIYPINRVQETPSDAYTVVDVARSSLGVGPCEYILDVEGQRQEYVGRATCAARDALKAIFEDHQQKKKRREAEEALDDALAFVTHIRSRISSYVDFGREIREYLADQRKLRPDLSEPLAELEQIAGELDERLAERVDKIKTPQFVAQMNEDFRREVLPYDGPDVLDRLKKYTDALTQVGGNQDELVGECRWIVRTLRQQAGILMATDPRCAAVAEEVRRRTRQALANPATYEGVRH